MQPIFIIYHNLSLGGVSKKIVDIIEHAETITHTPVVLILREKTKCSTPILSIKKNLTIHYFSQSLFRVIPLFFPFYCLLLAIVYRPNYILAFSFTPGICATLIKKFRSNTTVIIGDDSSFLNEEKRELFFLPHWTHNFLLTQFYSRANRYLVVAKHIEKLLISKYHVSKSKIVLINNWFDPHLLGKKPLKKDYDLTYIGRLDPLKNVMEFVRFSCDLIRRYPNLHIAIVGDGSEFDTLKSYITLNSLHQIDLVGYSDNPNTFLRHSSILVLPSLSEGQPLVVLDAYALGIPVLCHSFPSATEIVDHGKTGHIYHNKKEFVAYAKLLIANQKKYSTMSKEASKRAYASYHPNNITQYTRLLNIT